MRNVRAVWLALLLACAFTPSCNRLGAAGSADPSASGGGSNLPFHPGTGPDQGAPGQAEHPSINAEGQDSLPFRSPHLRVLPSGTLITVRLESPLDSSAVHAGDAFTAGVAEPVIIDGDTLVARGASVIGVVESTQRSIDPRRAGYIRLTLNDLMIEGKRLPLQTSSLFEGASRSPQGSSADASAPSGVRLPPGRRLTFRLTVPASLEEQNTHAHQDAIPSTE